MEYLLNQEQLYKLMKPFFDSRFKNSELGIRDYGGEEWKGFWSSDGQLLVGTANYEDDNNYYFNGEYFGNEWEIFDIGIGLFSDMMARYLKEEYHLIINSLT
jgi:hypothetical protein